MSEASQRRQRPALGRANRQRRQIVSRPTTGGTRPGGIRTGTYTRTNITGLTSRGIYGVMTGGAPPVGGLGGTGTGAGGLATTSVGTGGTRNLTYRPRPIFRQRPKEGIVAGSTEEVIHIAPIWPNAHPDEAAASQTETDEEK